MWESGQQIARKKYSRGLDWEDGRAILIVTASDETKLAAFTFSLTKLFVDVMSCSFLVLVSCISAGFHGVFVFGNSTFQHLLCCSSTNFSHSCMSFLA